MSSTIPEHAADEAGGEAIYSSDGLPPLPSIPPLAPIPKPTTSNDDLIEYDTTNPTDAFEVFSGKLFASSSETSTRVVGETPLEKLARLKREVASLEADLATPKRGGVSGVEKQSMMQMANALSVQLNEMNVRNGALKRQEDLSEIVHSQLSSYSSSSSAEEAEAGEGKVSYELYASSLKSQDDAEERLRKLEVLVGASTEGGSSVLKRLEEAEEMVQKVDDGTLEKAAARAKVIRADLEAAAKARLKLSALHNTPPLKNDDTKTISALYDQLTSLENITHYLPTIVTRLQDLATLHSTSATFATRLGDVETLVNASEKRMKDVEEALQHMEKGLEENVKVVQENMKVLDERMKALS
mmetsp:Transcript_14398/g.21253  ORF Transcript_14398/g.21253 Transcript_14398/m.21253 type:complete len:357 (+) Transcript_14398:74-1144(+)